MVQVLENSLEKGSVTFAVPIFCEEPTCIAEHALKHVFVNRCLAINSPLAFVTLQSIIFKDGARWVSWCTNPACEPFRAANPTLFTDFFGGEDYSHVHSDGYIGRDGKVCKCGLAAMSSSWEGSEFLAGLCDLGDVGVILGMACNWILAIPD